MVRLWLVFAVAAVEAVRREGGGASANRSDAQLGGCPCQGLALESQFARMVAVSYDAKGIRSLESYAKEIFSCYSWNDFYYELPKSGIIGRILSKVSWSTPTAFVGRCAMRPQMCAVTFSGATNLNFVAGIMDYGPVHLYRNATGGIEEGETSGDHRFHKFYWEVYKVFRSQIGAQVLAALHDCSEIYITGHSIGAAMAAVFQWENLEKNMYQMTMGQNVAWFGKPPDVGCRGKRIYTDLDPVPFLRCFVDKHDGEVVRHAMVPPQKLIYRRAIGTYKAEEVKECENEQPIDPACADGCSPAGVHYTYRITTGITSHQASEYVKATDSAFSPYAVLSPS